MESETEDLDDADKEARNAIRALKHLRDSAGWKYISRVLTEQIRARTDYVMLTPRKDVNEFEIEFQRGEAAMARAVITLVDTEIETLSAVKESVDGN